MATGVTFYRGMTDAQALQNKDSKDLEVPVGGIMFTSDNHIYMRDSETTQIYGDGNDSDTKFDEGTTSAVKVGGLEVGDDISDKTALEVLDLILNVDYAPMWNAATATISKSTNSLVKVGTSIPEATSFTTGGVTAYTEGKTNAYGGALTSESLSVSGGADETVTFGTTIYDRRTITVTYTHTFAEGTDTVVSSKGTATNKIAGNKTTKLASASTDTSKVTAEDHVAELTVSADTSILFAYPVWVNGEELLTYNTKAFVCPDIKIGEDGVESVTFEIPAAYTATMTYYDPVLQKELDIISSEFTTTENTTYDFGNGAVSYKKYTYNETSGFRTYTFTVTI